ncbi:MAG TPA: hypothetical protein VF594_12045 [Rubricoccaceae bacterium]
MALLFSVDGMNLGSFEGGIGGKWWTGSAVAVTVGLRLDTAARQGESSETAEGFETSTLRTAFALGAELHAEGGRRFSPFVGVEAGMGALRERFASRPPSGVISAEQVRRETNVEGAVRLGVEYRLSERFSLAGQQGVRASAFQGTERITEAGQREEVRPTSGYGIGLGASSLTLAVYL